MPSSKSRKDLIDLHRLSRTPAEAYLRRQARPSSPRRKAGTIVKRPLLGSFSPMHQAKWVTEYVVHRLGHRHAFLDYSQTGDDNGIYRLEGHHGEVRIALAGDWATGTDEAHEVAQLMKRYQPHYTIHLGDVYFVGDVTEVGENFLGINNEENGYEPCAWPMGSHGSFALNGNHEMYALGYAYFDHMLPKLGLCVDGKQVGQHASFFCLENDHWRIIALDTAFNSVGWPMIEYFSKPDARLPEPLMQWLRDEVQLRPDDPRGIILMSHQQYVSRFEDCFDVPARQLAPFIGHPVLWFWGHEHRMAIYEEAGLPDNIRALGRCVGHGGMPVELSPAKPRHPEYKVEFVDDRLYPNDENLKIGYNGFARMTFRGPQLSVDYVDIEGTVVFSEVWQVDKGALTRR
ncbi:MAG: metallophosphoesterase [Alphaproteobacteria bacterium]|nr:metallophosphoesterase [Alphaproteobacteria bacterium]